MTRRFSAQKALDVILNSLNDDSDSDYDESISNSISDADYEEDEEIDSSDDYSEDECNIENNLNESGNIIVENSENDEINTDATDHDMDDDNFSSIIMNPDIEKHIDECIQAVIERGRETFVSKDGTIWHSKPFSGGRRQSVNVMRASGGLSAYGRRHCNNTALSNWHIFIDDSILDIIVECTNDKANSMKANFVTNREEIIIFIGVTILIGVYKGRGEPVRSIWSESEGRRCINQFMSRNRFDMITKFLRFDLSNSRNIRRQKTKFAPMGSIYDMWQQKLGKPYIPHEYVTVDETLVPFRGRCSFKQYMPSKPAKYGLKFWCLCDAKTGYCLKMKPYLGTDHGDNRVQNLGKKVVMDLTEHLDIGRTVVTDNFFTSLELLRELRSRNLGLVGTVRKNRRELPLEFVEAKCEEGKCLFGFSLDATLVSFAPKKISVWYYCQVNILQLKLMKKLKSQK